jgi:aldehyde:ferredoxin oxidoreductase
MAGYEGKILDVNLSTGAVKTSKIEEDVLRKFIGGSGLAAKLFFDRVPPDVDPLSDKNVLFLMAGPLSGTNFPTSSRIVAASNPPRPEYGGRPRLEVAWLPR